MLITGQPKIFRRGTLTYDQFLKAVKRYASHRTRHTQRQTSSADHGLLTYRRSAGDESPKQSTEQDFSVLEGVKTRSMSKSNARQQTNLEKSPAPSLHAHKNSQQVGHHEVQAICVPGWNSASHIQSSPPGGNRLRQSGHRGRKKRKRLERPEPCLTLVPERPYEPFDSGHEHRYMEGSSDQIEDYDADAENIHQSPQHSSDKQHRLKRICSIHMQKAFKITKKELQGNSRPRLFVSRQSIKRTSTAILGDGFDDDELKTPAPPTRKKRRQAVRNNAAYGQLTMQQGSLPTPSFANDEGSTLGLSTAHGLQSQLRRKKENELSFEQPDTDFSQSLAFRLKRPNTPFGPSAPTEVVLAELSSFTAPPRPLQSESSEEDETLNTSDVPASVAGGDENISKEDIERMELISPPGHLARMRSSGRWMDVSEEIDDLNGSSSQTTDRTVRGELFQVCPGPEAITEAEELNSSHWARPEGKVKPNAESLTQLSGSQQSKTDAGGLDQLTVPLSASGRACSAPRTGFRRTHSIPFRPPFL